MTVFGVRPISTAAGASTTGAAPSQRHQSTPQAPISSTASRIDAMPRMVPPTSTGRV